MSFKHNPAAHPRSVCTASPQLLIPPYPRIVAVLLEYQQLIAARLADLPALPAHPFCELWQKSETNDVIPSVLHSSLVSASELLFFAFAHTLSLVDHQEYPYTSIRKQAHAYEESKFHRHAKPVNQSLSSSISSSIVCRSSSVRYQGLSLKRLPSSRWALLQLIR